MGFETERKFLVKGEFRHLATSSSTIIQRYLAKDPEKTIRIRIADDKAWLTIKGKPMDGSITRGEWEIPLEKSEALEIMDLCLPGKIEKTRYLVPDNGHVFEVDVFHDKNEGLVIAELELDSDDETYEIPAWLGDEVTGDRRYYNSWLAK